MQTLQFKTNIKCSGCVAQVTPVLDKIAGSDKWKVDTQSADKTLTVQAPGISAPQVVAALQGAGFTAEPLAETEKA